jgi:hypothetical protein
VFGVTGGPLTDFSADGDATEFTIAKLPSYAVIDLSR